MDSYCRHLAESFDYLIEVSKFMAPGRQFTKMELNDAIEAYGDYLQMGVAASSEIARTAAAQLKPYANASTSLVPKRAAIRRFLRLSEEVRRELAELTGMSGEARHLVDGDSLMPGLGQQRALQHHEVRAMRANSMLAGVVAGGPKFIDCVVLKGGTDDEPYDARRAFPYDKAMALIDAAPTYRDKAHYSLLAACGCRTPRVAPTAQGRH